MRYIIFILVISVLFLSCQEEDQLDLFNTYNVDAGLQQYFERFEQEGQLRGVAVDLALAGIEGYIERLEHGIAGTCSYSSNEPRKVTISRWFWNRADDFEREYVVFHELGHCFLNLPHDDRSLSDGSCISIMESGEGQCRMNYTSATRTYYLDQLFTR